MTTVVDMTAAGQNAAEACTLTNFGRNQTWRARCCYRPASEQDVLDILRRHRNGQVRGFGARHSWSDVAATSDAALDMDRLDEVRPFTRQGRTFVRVGAGCRLKHLLKRLHAATDQTLPTLGAITRQTISGATATGTHGSGRQSLSHFVAAVRVAAYDASGTPTIVEYDTGEALQAARCALGCMGIVVSVDLDTVPRYLVDETVRRHATLQSVLERYDARPLTQFVLVPHRWTWVAWERQAVAMRQRTWREHVKARACRIYYWLSVDIAFHLLLETALLFGNRAVKGLMRLMPHLLREIARVDDAEHVLTLRHDYFRHEEMEIFVPESALPQAVEVLQAATDVFAGETTSVPPAIAVRLKPHGLDDELARCTGTYVQHYPFFFRRVLGEDTLISMASGAAGPFYSISVFTFLPAGRRQAYYVFCAWLARCMTTLFGARLHWGKHFPLAVDDIAPLYPALDRFQQLCLATDPNGVFRNDYTRRVLGF